MIAQLDGNVSDLISIDQNDATPTSDHDDIDVHSDNNDDSGDDYDESDNTDYDTEDEAFSEPIPANLTLVSGQHYRNGKGNVLLFATLSII